MQDTEDDAHDETDYGADEPLREQVNASSLIWFLLPEFTLSWNQMLRTNTDPVIFIWSQSTQKLISEDHGPGLTWSDFGKKGQFAKDWHWVKKTVSKNAFCNTVDSMWFVTDRHFSTCCCAHEAELENIVATVDCLDNSRSLLYTLHCWYV